MVDDKEIVIVGRLGKPRGIDGEIFVTPETDFPERFKGLKNILVQNKNGWQSYKIESDRFISGRPLFKFVGFNSSESVARLTNCNLGVKKSELHALPENSYFHFDLIGCAVYDLDDELVGELKEVDNYPGNDVYLVEDKRTGRMMRIAAVKEFVKNVDIKNKIIKINRQGLVHQ